MSKVIIHPALQDLIKDYKPLFSMEHTTIDYSEIENLLNQFLIPISKETIRWLAVGGRIPKKLVNYRKIQRFIRQGKFPKTPARNLIKTKQVIFENCYIKSIDTQSRDTSIFKNPDSKEKLAAILGPFLREQCGLSAAKNVEVE